MTIHRIRCFGDFACFSRPEMKVERLSYPCPTPSAARGIFDAIYVKPLEFRWEVTQIDLLASPQFIALRRNEAKEKVNAANVIAWADGSAAPEPIWADGDRALTGSDERGRTQRQTIALKNPAYRLHARIVPWPGFEKQLPAFDAQFQRRASAGKCFQQPYFGCREFPAYFEVDERGDGILRDLNLDIGLMVYDVWDMARRGGQGHDRPSISFFEAVVRAGVLDVPPFDSGAVLKPQEAR
ncbi:MAG: hypothetical protein AMXMBFR57_36190 [Acidimicrobiia bacterium]